MPNALDHRLIAAESWADAGAALAAALLGATNTNGLDAAYPTGCTYAYGAAAGTSPTAFTTQAAFSAGSNPLRGTIFFNTGSSPPAVTTAASATILTVTFPVVVPIANLNVAPYIFITPLGTTISGNTGGPVGTAGVAVNISATPTMTSTNCTGFTLRTNASLIASTGTATAAGFAVSYLVLG